MSSRHIIFGVGFDLPTENDDFIQIDSKKSLSDADIVIFNPSFEGTSYYTDYSNSPYQGKTLYNPDSSFRIKDHFQHWQTEIANLLKAGRTVFVILSYRRDFFVHTGNRETSGTGRNQKVTQLVEPYDNYRFLQVKEIKIFHSEGSKVYTTGNVHHELNLCLENFLKHEAHISSSFTSQTILYTTKNKDKTLGLSLKIGEGNLVFIPNIDFPKNFYEKNKWSKEALAWGKRFEAALISFCKANSGEVERTPTPSWANSEKYTFQESKEKRTEIQNYIEEISKIQEKVEELNKAVIEIERYKALLFETGKPLETAVTNALRVLGFQAENYNDGKLELDQVIVSPEGVRYIGECEGKDNKDIDISKFRQLLDSLNEDFSRDSIDEKAFGILFGNPQRLLDPKERTLDFTDKCRRAADREKIALIKTCDLYEVIKNISENTDETYIEKCRKAIHEQLGQIVVFPKI